MLHSTFRAGKFIKSLMRPLLSTAMSSDSMRISVTPQLGLIDDPLRICVSGLDPGQRVTLQTFLQDFKLKFISCGHYSADHSGRVDVNQQASVGGCYTGVESTGLIWSMVQAPGQRAGLLLMKRDANQPFDIHLYVHDGHIDLETCYQEQSSDAVLVKTIFKRTYRHPDVTRVDVREGRLRGALFSPPGPGPFPVVLDLFGTAGGLVETRAALLASRGFQVLALAYFAYDDLQPFLAQIDLDYFEDAVDYLTNLPTSNGHGVGVIGVSKGAEIALMMSESMPKVRAVVSINGLYFRSTNRVIYKNCYLPIALPDYSKVKTVDKALELSGCFDKNQVDDDAVIKVEKSDAQFLIIASGDDGQCPPWTSEMCADRLRSAGRTNFQFVVYEGAGHLLEAPHSPFCRAGYHSKFGCDLLWGGEILKHTRAQEMSWRRILNFLHKSLDGSAIISKL